jgi:hypothetical protein
METSMGTVDCQSSVKSTCLLSLATTASSSVMARSVVLNITVVFIVSDLLLQISGMLLRLSTIMMLLYSLYKLSSTTSIVIVVLTIMLYM